MRNDASAPGVTAGLFFIRWAAVSPDGLCQYYEGRLDWIVQPTKLSFQLAPGLVPGAFYKPFASPMWQDDAGPSVTCIFFLDLTPRFG